MNLLLIEDEPQLAKNSSGSTSGRYPPCRTTGNGLGLSIVKQIGDNSAMSLRYSYTAGRHSFRIGWTTC